MQELNLHITFSFAPAALMTALTGMEDALVFVQDELHYLVLKDHVHRDVG